MDINTILTYISALIVGVVLGLIGGGGSILTVPIFVYLMHFNPVTATAYSLFVVGFTALVGAFRNFQKGLVDFRTAFVFATPAFIAVYLTRKYLVPAIPDTLFTLDEFIITKEIGIMILFALIMLFASFSMIKDSKKKTEEENTEPKYNYVLIIIEGFIIGVLTGLVGAGGGFLIIPALVLLAKLPMKKAIATSLLIIAIKSLIGFLGDVENLEIDWSFLLIFTAISVIGIFIGIYLSNFIEDKKLKKGFGWLVLLMALFIIVKEIVK